MVPSFVLTLGARLPLPRTSLSRLGRRLRTIVLYVPRYLPTSLIGILLKHFPRTVHKLVVLSFRDPGLHRPRPKSLMTCRL